ncbi:unnamed protein product [marine sediment metagenome]|uniref:Uncharacterized protein n=1 Tax=marine sediment metagenome TaxID=412755 RepID=X0REW3_9ZZZZ
MTNIESKEPKENSKEKKRRYLYKFLLSALFRIEEKTDKKVPLAPYPKKAILIIIKAK